MSNKLSFSELGLCPKLVKACTDQGWDCPTPIQHEALPYSINKHDIIGLAETGSGKTGAYALPIIQELFNGVNVHPFFALIVSPTRELAYQIHDTFSALSSAIGTIKIDTIVGGMDEFSQARSLSKNKPHVIIATPGRIVYHLENTKGFSLLNLRYLVFDEADKLLGVDFEDHIQSLLKTLPRSRSPQLETGRITSLWSATMTSNVKKLQRASLYEPVKVSVSQKYATVSSLIQHYLFFPAKEKDCYLVYLMKHFSGNSILIFTSTCLNTERLSLILRNLGISAISLNGRMPQPMRLSALNKFRAGDKHILIATDVASRGLDIPLVDVVINYDMPTNPKDYIHRVGRTARAGRSGRAITFVTQYDTEQYLNIEKLIEQKLEKFDLYEEDIVLLKESVMESQRLATIEMKHKQDEAKKNRKKRPNFSTHNTLKKKK